MTMNEAAKAVGVSKTTIWRAVKAGRLSAGKNDAGQFVIEESELCRVFPAEQDSTVAVEQFCTVTEADLLRVKLEAEQTRAALLQSQLDEARQERDHWRDHAQRLLLAAPPVASPSRGLWGWLGLKKA